jgi:profilin
LTVKIFGRNRLRSVFTLQMSWQEYVEKNLVGTGKVCKAAIVSLDGSVLAQTAGLNALLPPHHSAALLAA